MRRRRSRNWSGCTSSRSASWRRRATEADQILSNTRSDANRFREELKQKAQAEAAGIVKNAERQIELETARALQQIRTEAVDYLGGDCVQAARAQRVEGRQRAPHRRDLQADRRSATQLSHQPQLRLQLVQKPGV